MSMNEASELAPAGADIDAVIGENVHQLMWRAKESQTAVAPMLGITQSALSHKLRGRRPWYAAEISTVARHYGVTVDELFAEAGPNVPSADYEVEGSGAIVVDLASRRSAAKKAVRS